MDLSEAQFFVFFLTSNLALIFPPLCHVQVFQPQVSQLPGLLTLQPPSPPQARRLPCEGFLCQTQAPAPVHGTRLRSLVPPS